MNSATILLLASLAVSASLYGQSDPSKSSDVTFEFVYSQGRERGLAGRLIVDSDNGRVFDAHVTNEVVLHLPYGKYPIVFVPDGFLPISRSVVVDQPEHFVVLTRSLTQSGAFIEDFGPVAPSAIRATVQPVAACGAGRSLWAKIVGVYSDYTDLRKIGPEGSLLFDDLDDGLYVLMVLDGNKPRLIQTVETNSKITLDIKLQDCSKPQ